MTGTELFKNHKKEFSKGLKEDLLAFIDANDPARRIASEPANDRMHGSAMWVGEIAAFQRLRATFAALGEPLPGEEEVPVTFSTPEV